VDKPETYRIRFRGILPEGWGDRLGGLKVTARSRNGVTLEGCLPDQAALAGVLDTLLMLRLQILEVLCLSVDEESWTPQPIPDAVSSQIHYPSSEEESHERTGVDE